MRNVETVNVQTWTRDQLSGQEVETGKARRSVKRLLQTDQLNYHSQYILTYVDMIRDLVARLTSRYVQQANEQHDQRPAGLNVVRGRDAATQRVEPRRAVFFHVLILGLQDLAVEVCYGIVVRIFKALKALALVPAAVETATQDGHAPAGTSVALVRVLKCVVDVCCDRETLVMLMHLGLPTYHDPNTAECRVHRDEQRRRRRL